jgi:hypothetical protein
MTSAAAPVDDHEAPSTLGTMAAVAPFEIASAPDEQRMLLHDVSWEKYVQLRDLLD